jgi:hypothetical protein
MSTPPSIAFSTNTGAYTGPDAKTPYMVRYEVAITGGGAAGSSSSILIHNNDTTTGAPNIGLDAMPGSALCEAAAQIENTSKIATDPRFRMTAFCQFPYFFSLLNLGNGNIEVIVSDPFGQSGTTYGYITIEYRHTLEQ